MIMTEKTCQYFETVFEMMELEGWIPRRWFQPLPAGL